VPLDSPAPQSSIDAENPWLGLASFTEDSRAWFHGREEEVAELARRVQRKLLTLLFGKSGLGKTSILQAGIVPRLRALGYCPVYVRIDYAQGSPPAAEQIKQAIFRASETSGQWTHVGVALPGESLWEFLHHRGDVLRDASGHALTPLLIFDQFEEIFTLAQGDDFGRRRAVEFVEELADLVENRPPRALEARIDADDDLAEQFDFTRSDYRVLIALREDYLAHLETFKAAMPSITQNRMRLAPMTGEQALEAVQKPGGSLVSQEVAEAIVRFTAGGAELRNAEVEPSLLSLICRELNNARIAQGRTEISADLLAGSHDTILAEFYERALADQPLGVRHFIEDQLLTESGFRESLAEERVQKAFAAAAAAPDALARLVDRRLLRVEVRLDVRRVELTHDVLCPVVRASRDLRREREARDEAERKLAEQQARERATHKALVRARQVAAICGVLALAAIASAFFGYESMQRARRAEAQAQQTRVLAEKARGEAEKLVVYLLDDFYRELEPIGRLDIVASLARRAVDYYAALPAELRTPDTERNRALALVRYGAALRDQSRIAESKAALDDAVATLAKMRSEGDASEATAVGLGLALSVQGRVAYSQNDRLAAVDLARRGVAVLEPLMSTGTASAALRRTYGLATTYLGFTQLQTGENDAAVATLAHARDAYRGIANLALDDLPAATAYAEASAWQMSALQNLGRFDDVRKVGDDAYKVTRQVLERRPGDMAALRAEGLLLGTLNGVEWNDLHLRKAQAATAQGARDWEAIVRLDPTNQIAWNNLADARIGVMATHFFLGEIGDARRQAQSALDIASHVKEAAFIGSVLALGSGYLARIDADAGDRKGAEVALAENRRFIALAVRDLPPDAYGRQWTPEVLGYYGYPGTGPGYGGFAVPLADGDYAAVRSLAHASAARLEKLQPASGQAEARDGALETAWRFAADAAYRMKDYAGADADIHRALAVRARLPIRTLGERRDVGTQSVLAGMIAARLGRLDEARALIDPVLAMQRELATRPGNDDQVQRFEYAQALYASALAGSSQRVEDLRQAAALLDALPVEMRQLISIRRWRQWIAEAQGS
jgi:hypothetical protein